MLCVGLVDGCLFPKIGSGASKSFRSSLDDEDGGGVDENDIGGDDVDVHV